VAQVDAAVFEAQPKNASCPLLARYMEEVPLDYRPGLPGASKRPWRSSQRIGFVWRFCLGAQQGAQQPKTAVSGPGSGRAARRAAPPRLDVRLRRPGRARSHCRFVLPLIHVIPQSLTYSVPLFLKRRCDRTLRPAPHPR
jgi:hypothetical protein